MATLTIRNVPKELHVQLKEQALRNRRSLNQEVIAELVERVESRDNPRARALRAEEMIARVTQLRKGMTRFMTPGEIDRAKNEGRR
jgi:plasmid stability protein